MKICSRVLVSLLLITVLLLIQLASPFSIDSAQANGIGPDIIVGDIQSVLRFDRVGDITAYGVGTTACNLGDERVDWVQGTNQHPVIFSNMYRFKDGRFEQIGMSWGFHEFYAVSQSSCVPCLDPAYGGSQLGVGCSSPTSAALAGYQINLGKRSEINANTGYFQYPPSPPWGDTPGTSIDRRLQIQDSYLDPSLNADALYFVDGHYISPGDAEADHNNNDASYRQVAVTETSTDIYDVVVQSVTQRGQSAIRAWQDNDPSVIETDIQTNEGLFILSAQTTDLGNGLWHYEYALQNINSDRSASSFSIPLPADAIIQNIGFHDVDYHSGEDYDLSDWSATVNDNSITWATESYADNPNANALRFGTLYNFWFDIYASPDSVEANIDLFKPGTPNTVNAVTVGPASGIIEIDIFDSSSGTIELTMPGGLVIAVELSGTSTMNIFFEGTLEGIARDDDADSLDEVQAQLVDLNLGGSNPILGSINIRLNSALPSFGEMEEQVNNTTGNLDLPPFASTGTAASFFDVFFEIEIGVLLVHTVQPVGMIAVIQEKPPVGDIYYSTEPFELFNENGEPTGIILNSMEYQPGDDDVGLTDAILVLQLMAGIQPASIVYKQADINGDEKIGITEVIYILQKISELRE